MIKCTVTLTVELGAGMTPDDVPEIAQHLSRGIEDACDGFSVDPITAADFSPVPGPRQRLVWFSVDADGYLSMWSARPVVDRDGDWHEQWRLLNATVRRKFGTKTFGVGPGECKLVVVDWPEELEEQA